MELYFDLISIDLRKEILKSVRRIYLINTSPDVSLFQLKSFISCNNEVFWKDLYAADISSIETPNTIINRDDYSRAMISVSEILKIYMFGLFNGGATQLIISTFKNDWRGILDWHISVLFCESCNMCNLSVNKYIREWYYIKISDPSDGLKNSVKTLFNHTKFFFDHNGGQLLASLVRDAKKYNIIPQVILNNQGKLVLYEMDLAHILEKDEFREIIKLLITHEILPTPLVHSLVIYIINNLPSFKSTATQTANILYLISALPRDDKLNERKKSILDQAFGRKSIYLIQHLIMLKCSKIEETHLYLAANISRELFDSVFSAYTTQTKESDENSQK